MTKVRCRRHRRRSRPLCFPRAITDCLARTLRSSPPWHLWRSPHPEHPLCQCRNLALQRARRELYLRLCPHCRRKVRCLLEGKGSVKPKHFCHQLLTRAQQPTWKASFGWPARKRGSRNSKRPLTRRQDMERASTGPATRFTMPQTFCAATSTTCQSL